MSSRAARLASIHGSRPAVVAHRGASQRAPENTLAAYRVALDLGCSAGETDVHLAADGGVIVMHDATTERTTGRHGRIDEGSTAELTALDAGRWFGEGFAGECVPTLGPVLDLVRGRMALCVEIKAGEAVVEAVAALVDDRAMRGDIVIFSFDPMTIAAARRRLPDCPAVLLLSEWGQPARYAPGDVRDAGACGATAIGFDGRVPHEGLVAAAHAAGLPVFAWTINDVATARALAAEGVDVLISDVPDLIEAGLG